MWSRTALDSRYISHLDVQWTQISKVIGNLDGRKSNLKVGLLNFNNTEVKYWQELLTYSELLAIHLEHAKSNITWDDLYPEWIDEEEESEVPSCPHLPEPRIPKGLQFDLVAVKLPCNKSGSWSRDVARLHLQLTAARLAAFSRGDHKPVHVLFVTNCFPIPNLFSCKSLVNREGDAWLYKPDLKLLKQKVELPVGSCKLAIPLKAKGQLLQ